MFSFTFTWIKLFGILAIIISVFFDEIRDAFWNVVNFWKSHVPKWASLFPLYLFIIYVTKMEWWVVILLAFSCNKLWHFNAKYVAPMPTAGSLWKVHLPALIKKIFGDDMKKFFDWFFAKDEWFGLDKILHLIGCMVITAIWGYPTAGAAGIIKECADIGGSGFSYKDLTADAIGIGLGMIVRMVMW